MPTGSGLDGQLNIGQESVWGTAVVASRSMEFNSETLKFEPNWLEPTGLRVGTKYKRVSRLRQSRKSVSGEIEMEIATLGMGMLVRNMLGSVTTTTTQIAATTAYKQIHVPGDFRGLGMTVQVGRPEPLSGLVRPFTYSGVKVNDWEFSLEDNAVPTLTLGVDGRNEATATALAAAAYLAGSSVFDFSQATLKLGGTPTTAAGETTISGGTAPSTVIRSLSISGEAPKETERFGIGNAGLKSEQLENDVPTITGTLAAEFNKNEFYDIFQANTSTSLQLDLTGALIASGNNFLFSIILPSVRYKSAAPSVSGPDIVSMSTDFEAYSNEVDPVIQIKIVSTETTAV